MGTKPPALLASLTLVSVFAVACGSASPPPAQTETKTVTVTIATPFATPSSASPQPSIPAPSAGIGQEVRDGSFAFTVTQVWPIKQGSLDLLLTVRNLANSAQTYVADYQKLIDADGREFSADIHSMTSAPNPPFAVIQRDINPGVELEVGLAFSVPDDMKPAQLVLHASTSSSGVVVNLT
jgi:hypothetical protein